MEKSAPAKKKPHRDSDKYIVRLPDGMRETIAAAAKANEQTMNAEIVQRLQQSFEAGPTAEVALVIARKDYDLLEAEARALWMQREAMEFAQRVQQFVEQLDPSALNGPAKARAEELTKWTAGMLADGLPAVQQELDQTSSFALAAHRRWRDLALARMPPGTPQSRRKPPTPGKPKGRLE